MSIDVRAVLDGFDSNEGLQAEVQAASIPDLEAWVPTLVEALRGRDTDPARLATNMDSLFSALATRDIFLAALLTKIVEIIPNDRKVALSRMLSKLPRYQTVVRDLHAAIERGDIVREVDEEHHTVTFKRKG